MYAPGKPKLLRITSVTLDILQHIESTCMPAFTNHFIKWTGQIVKLLVIHDSAISNSLLLSIC